MPGDLESLPVRLDARAGRGLAVLAAELFSRMEAELPAVGGLGERGRDAQAREGAARQAGRAARS